MACPPAPLLKNCHGVVLSAYAAPLKINSSRWTDPASGPGPAAPEPESEEYDFIRLKVKGPLSAGPPAKSSLRETVEVLGTAFLLALVIKFFLIQAFSIPRGLCWTPC